MAYTIKATPPALASFNNDLIYTVAYPEHTSNPSTYSNYKFIADIYHNTHLIARMKKVQDPATGIGIFNIAEILRSASEMVGGFSPSTTSLVSQELSNDNFWLSVQVKFGEEYGYTDYLNLLVDTERVYVNSYEGRPAGASTAIAAYVNKICSNRPVSNDVTRNAIYSFLPYFCDSTSTITVTVTPNVGGAPVVRNFTPSRAFNLMLLNLSPILINTLAAGTITPSTQYYTVQVGSQTYRFNIICEPVYQTYMVHFMNKFGGFDSRVFSKVSRRSFDIERKDFGQLNYRIDGSGNVSYKDANGIYNEARSIYAVQAKEKMVLNTDLLTDAEQIWLGELIMSPLIYIEENGYMYPVAITDNNYEPKKFVNDDLTNLSINIEFGYQLNTQFR